MTTVKILCGGYGLHIQTPVGASTKLITMGQTCEVEPEEAERLVFLGLAEVVGAECVATPAVPQSAESTSGDSPTDSGAQSGVSEATLDPVQLASMSFALLKELARDMGLACSGCRSRADYIALISAARVKAEIPVEDRDLPPVLSAENPV